MGRTAEQERQYKRAYRAKQRAMSSDTESDNVSPIGPTRHAATTEFRVFESAEEAVREEIKSLPLAAARPTEVAAALRLAQILDDKSASNRVAAAEKLRLTMDGLRGGGSSVVNPLRALRASRNAG